MHDRLTRCKWSVFVITPSVQEGKALEDKLGNLKDQLTDLRSAIKSFETEFDQRLDACLQQVSMPTCALP